jgi:hypothetical protein
VISEEGVVAGTDDGAERLLAGCNDLFIERRRLRCRSLCALELFRAIRVATRTSPHSGFRSTFHFSGSPPLTLVVLPAPECGRPTPHALLLLTARDD